LHIKCGRLEKDSHRPELSTIVSLTSVVTHRMSKSARCYKTRSHADEIYGEFLSNDGTFFVKWINFFSARVDYNIATVGGHVTFASRMSRDNVHNEKLQNLYSSSAT
jgi:hypothetical protein